MTEEQYDQVLLGQEAIARYMRMCKAKWRRKHQALMRSKGALFEVNARKGECRFWTKASRVDKYCAWYNRERGPL